MRPKIHKFNSSKESLDHKLNEERSQANEYAGRLFDIDRRLVNVRLAEPISARRSNIKGRRPASAAAFSNCAVIKFLLMPMSTVSPPIGRASDAS